MKCPTCGETIRNGRCPFCGFRPTQEDLAAEAKWAEEKKRLSGGGSAGADWKAERPAFAALAEKARAGMQRKPAAQRPKPAAKPPRQRAEQAGQRRRAEPAQKRNQKAPAKEKKSGASLTLLLKLAVAIWVVFIACSLCSVLAGEYGIDLPGLVMKLFHWIGSKLAGEPEYIVPQGNYILYG